MDTKLSDNPFFTGLDSLPWAVPTKQDLEDGNPRKSVGVSINEYFCNIYDLHDPEQLAAYKEARLKQIELMRYNRCHIKRDTTVVLNIDGKQRLHAVMEWVDAISSLYEEDLDGKKTKVIES